MLIISIKEVTSSSIAIRLLGRVRREDPLMAAPNAVATFASSALELVAAFDERTRILTVAPNVMLA